MTAPKLTPFVRLMDARPPCDGPWDVLVACSGGYVTRAYVRMDVPEYTWGLIEPLDGDSFPALGSDQWRGLAEPPEVQA